MGTTTKRRTPKQVLRDQLRDVEKGIRHHQLRDPQGIILKDLKKRREYIKAELERLKWRKALEVQHEPR